MAHWTPQEVLDTGQLIKYESIRDMLVDYGFELREHNGSSHVPLRHAIHHDLSGIALRTTEKLSSQREAAKLCLEVMRRELELNTPAPPPATETSAPEPLLPEDILVQESDHFLILTHRDYPVIGKTVPYNGKKETIPEIIYHHTATVRNGAKDLATLISTAQTYYEIKIETREDGGLELSDLHYPDNIEIIPPYTSTDNNPVDTIQQAIRFVQLNDGRQKDYFEALTESRTGFVSPIVTTNSEHLLPVTFINPLTRNTKEIKLPTTPQGRITERDLISCVSQYFNHLFQPETFKALEARFGIQTKGMSDNELRFSHPVMGLEIRTNNPSRLLQDMKLNELFSCAADFENRNMRDDLVASEIIPWAKSFQTVWSEMDAFAELTNEHIRRTAARMKQTWDFLNGHLGGNGLSYASDQRMTRFGKLFGSKYSFTDDPKDSISFSSILVQPNPAKPEAVISLLSERDMERLEEFSVRVKEKIHSRPAFSLVSESLQPPATSTFDDVMGNFSFFR